ncbi:MAG: quinolinate synthase NadA [Fidelibacterota bacterium]
MKNFILPEKYQTIDKNTLAKKISAIREQFGKNLLILGHHYQRDSVLQHCDERGDSFALAKIAANASAETIVFCGVHFMAETADIVTNDNQKVYIPDPTAGCFLADCANIQQIEAVWEKLTAITDEKIIPITYINSAADLKAFTGKHDGIVCTSSNAAKALQKAREAGDKVFFFPDQHLGRNTGVKMGIDLSKIKLWEKEGIGLTEDDIHEAEIILWDGYCDVHQEFSSNYVDFLRKTYKDIKIVAHPECDYSVCQKADYTGSTKEIIELIENSRDKVWGVGTEKHLVNRLQKQHPEKEIYFLQDYEPKCTTMAQITPEHLLYQLENLAAGLEENRVRVDKNIAKDAQLALDRMLKL